MTELCLKKEKKLHYLLRVCQEGIWVGGQFMHNQKTRPVLKDEDVGLRRFHVTAVVKANHEVEQEDHTRPGV